MPHEIEVINLRDGEIVSHSLIIVRGIVRSRQNSDSAAGDIIARVNQWCNQSSVLDGHFKLLLELQLGLNSIRLEYADDAIELNIELTPRDTNKLVLPVYIICCDEEGQFQGPSGSDCSVIGARERIMLVTRLLQAVLAEKLWEAGVTRRTFAIDESLGCYVHKSSLSSTKACAMTQEQLWEHFARELVTTWGAERSVNVKFLAFLACTRYEGCPGSTNLTHEEILARTKGHVALGGGGLAIFGTGCMHTWPRDVQKVISCLYDSTPVDQAQLMDDSCYRGTYGGCCSTTIGSVLHELCHTFDLGHTTKGIMGRGFDRMDLVLSAEPSSRERATVNFTVNLKVDFCSSEKRQEEECAPVRNKTRGVVPLASEDQTYLTQSCVYLLAYHRWFNSSNLVGDIKFDEMSWTLRSNTGLRVVEIRRGDRQVVRNSWCFSHARQVFVVPRSTSIHTPYSELPALLVAEDNAGNILRHTLRL